MFNRTFTIDITERAAASLDKLSDALAALAGNNKSETLSRIERKIDTMSSNLDSKLDELQAAITAEMQQLRDAIAAGAAGQEAVAEVERATEKVQAAIDALKSDDAPAPAES